MYEKIQPDCIPVSLDRYSPAFTKSIQNSVLSTKTMSTGAKSHSSIMPTLKIRHRYSWVAFLAADVCRKEIVRRIQGRILLPQLFLLYPTTVHVGPPLVTRTGLLGLIQPQMVQTIPSVSKSQKLLPAKAAAAALAAPLHIMQSMKSTMYHAT